MPHTKDQYRKSWKSYVIDTLLACAGTLLMTQIIYALKLTTVSNISLLYLLFIIPLGAISGYYAALVASILSLLAFDYFLLPPLYTLRVNRWEDWIALLVFLVTALVTSRLTATTRKSAISSYQKEQELQTLYEFLRVTNSQEALDDLLQVIAFTMVKVFSPWGVCACALLLPNKQGYLVAQADAPIRVDGFPLTPDEIAMATHVMQGRKPEERCKLQNDQEGKPIEQCLRLIPLKTQQQVLGVMCLRLHNAAPCFAHEVFFAQESQQPQRHICFFWTFIEQATTAIERTQRRDMNRNVLQ
ncbi:MAG TPA: DUF4118 domain-containing protein [Ktedonobacteraceae bacterium]|nr:DUF4118 domain-containing protein [Ktedonobacteraceae bacterium]